MASKGRGDTVDPQKGYTVRELKPNIIMITEGSYESVLATARKAVVLFDAPPCFAQHIVQAMTETTYQSIVELGCSHIHVDHTGRARLIPKQAFR
ncbi:MAG: hypothetical protein WCA38_21965 [Candidatus Acidiferrales bacterium]